MRDKNSIEKEYVKAKEAVKHEEDYSDLYFQLGYIAGQENKPK